MYLLQYYKVIALHDLQIFLKALIEPSSGSVEKMYGEIVAVGGKHAENSIVDLHL